MLTERAHQAATMLSPEIMTNGLDEYNMVLRHVRMPVAVALGARYFIFPSNTNPNFGTDDDPQRPSFKRLAFKDGMGLWEAEGVPGFAYLSDYVWAVPDEAGAEHWLQNVTWEKAKGYAAAVEAPERRVEGIQRAPDGSSPGNTAVREYTPGHVVVEVDAKRPALLVVAESYYPGWKATLDDAPVDILRANYLSQGVIVPEGTHRIELRYEPDSFRYGAIVSVLILLGIVGLGVLLGYRGRRRARAADGGQENSATG
jgi:hypothetical protein